MKSIAIALFVCSFSTAVLFGRDLSESNWTQLETAVKKNESGTVSMHSPRNKIERWKSDPRLAELLEKLDEKTSEKQQKPVILFQAGNDEYLYYAAMLICDREIIYAKYSFPEAESGLLNCILQSRPLNKLTARYSKTFKDYTNPERIKTDALKYYGDSGCADVFLSTGGNVMFCTVWKDGIPDTMLFTSFPYYPDQSTAEKYADFFEKYGSLVKIMNFGAYAFRTTLYGAPYYEDKSELDSIRIPYNFENIQPQ